MSAGLFISFEGSEGCGKSTQIRLLSARLEALGRHVRVTREPGGTPIGEQIRHLLQFAEEGHAMHPETELLLFTASRAQLVREVIAPALAEGVVVLADRFLDSTTVYQGVARRLSSECVDAINQFATGGRLPDITFVLDLDAASARQRMLGRENADGHDRMEHQPDDFYDRVTAGYHALAAAEPRRLCLIDGSRAPDVIAADIWHILEDRFHGILIPSGL